MLIDNPIKQLFTLDNVWDKILQTKGSELRPVVIETIEKMLNCMTSNLGSRLYQCSNPNCTHSKFIHQSCKGRACPSCGKKATECWITEQLDIMPSCEWQHITFTIPDVFWPIFQANRWLMGLLFQCAAKILLKWGKTKGVEIGIFGALHTYGRQFNWNVHLHLSVTCGGLTETGEWKKVYFNAKAVRKSWRYNVITLLRNQHSKMTLPSHLQPPFLWYDFLNTQYLRYWYVYLAKKTKNAKRTVNYLGRYLKKMPLSASRLRHYKKGEMLNVQYLEHRSGKYETLSISPHELILRLIEHIPDKHFRMIRYYGFLANQHRSVKLPLVYAALNESPPEKLQKPTYRNMMKGFIKCDPFACILCGCQLLYSEFRKGCRIKDLVDMRMTWIEKQQRWACAG